jgi:iron(III) transport system ATP-binding protein
MKPPALELQDVEHVYGAQVVLRQISFQIQPGQILCLLGPSGCGKTTALRIAAGLEQPKAGRVLLAGRLMTGDGGFVPPEQRGVGLLFQDYALFPHLNVADNVGFGLTHLRSGERRTQTEAWLRRVDLWERRQAYPHMLSGGEQQRIALARALAPRPAVLLLDEPFSNLDSQLRQQVRAEVLRVLREIGATALLVTHDPEEALIMGDQIALMDQGRILQIGAALDLYFAPNHPRVAAFFGEVNWLSGLAQQEQVMTPFGALPAPGLADDTVVNLLIRPEGLKLERASAAAEPPHTIVTAVQLLGATSLIQFQFDAASGYDGLLQARMAGASRLKPGDAVRVTLDPDLAFVFPEP